MRRRESEGERGGRRRNEKQKKNVREAGKGVKAEKERREVRVSEERGDGAAHRSIPLFAVSNVIEN